MGGNVHTVGTVWTSLMLTIGCNIGLYMDRWECPCSRGLCGQDLC